MLSYKRETYVNPQTVVPSQVTTKRSWPVPHSIDWLIDWYRFTSNELFPPWKDITLWGVLGVLVLADFATAKRLFEHPVNRFTTRVFSRSGTKETVPSPAIYKEAPSCAACDHCQARDFDWFGKKGREKSIWHTTFSVLYILVWWSILNFISGDSCNPE